MTAGIREQGLGIRVEGIRCCDIRDGLVAEYSAECGIPALGEPKPQWAMYAVMEASGAMQAFAVFVGDEMAGFATVLAMVSPHYGVKVASVESMFVGQAYRASGAGTKLMAVVEAYALGAGCKALMYSAKAGSRLEALLDRRCDRTSSIFCKPLA